MKVYVCANKPGKVVLEEKKFYILLLLKNVALVPGSTQLSVPYSMEKQKRIERAWEWGCQHVYTVYVQPHSQALPECKYVSRGEPGIFSM